MPDKDVICCAMCNYATWAPKKGMDCYICHNKYSQNCDKEIKGYEPRICKEFEPDTIEKGLR